VKVNGEENWSFLLVPNFTHELAAQVREWKLRGVSYGDISRYFGIREDVARNIVLGRIYNDGSVPRKPFSPAKEAAYQEWHRGAQEV
jgi:hypothetical protein